MPAIILGVWNGGLGRGLLVAALLALGAAAQAQPPPAPPATGGPSTGARYPIGMAGPYVSRYPDEVQDVPPTIEQLNKPRVYDFDTRRGLYLDGFTLWMVDDLGLPDESQQSYVRLTARNMENGDYHLVIHVKKSPSLTDFFFYVRYHDDQFNPRDIQPGSAFGFEGDRLWFGKLELPGVVCGGMTRIRPDVNGGTKVDDAVICEIVFEKKQANIKTWWLERAPDRQPNRVENLTAYLDPSGCLTLYWQEANAGDFNNDGEVSLTDLIVVGRRYGRISTDGVEDDWDHFPDGNRDGEINRKDTWLIGENYGALLSGYRVYRRPADRPRREEVLLPHNTAPLLPLSIHRPVDWNPIRLNEYRYVDKSLTRSDSPRDWIYRIVPYNAANDIEGQGSDLELTLRVSGGVLSIVSRGEERKGTEGRVRKDSRMRRGD